MNHGKLRFTSTLVLGLLAAGVNLAAARANDVESEQARAIKAQFARQVERIKSLEVAYKLDTTSNLSPEKLHAIPEYMNQMFLPHDEWQEAFKGQKRYRRQIQPERVTYLAPVDETGLYVPPEPAADAPPAIRENQKNLRAEYDRAIANMKAIEARGGKFLKRNPAVRDRSEQDVTRGYNGKTLWTRKAASPTGFSYEVWSTTTKPNWFQVSAYLGALGLHVPDPAGKDPAIKGQAIFQLSEWIKEHPYNLEPKTEVLDGSTCVVLKGSLNAIRDPGYNPGDWTDRIWLDRDHGLVLRKREIALGGKLSNRWLTSDLKEVEPGIWLPMSTRQEKYTLKPHPDLNGKPVVIEEIHVQKLSVNKVADDRFDMIPQKGDSILDLRARF